MPTVLVPVAMKATQLVEGTRFADYKADEANYILVFKQAIAGCMDNVSIDDITYFNVSAVLPTSQTRSLRADQEGQERHWLRSLIERLLQRAESNAVIIEYQTDVTLGGLTFDELSTQLKTSVEVGVFDELLHEFAEEANIPGLLNATSTEVVTINLDQ
jgi:hypothetical protein